MKGFLAGENREPVLSWLKERFKVNTQELYLHFRMKKCS
jgi:hypothetical protein